VQLIDARGLWQKMRKSLGEKRKELSAEHIAEIARLYGDFTEGERVKMLPNEAFGFLRVTVERPLRRRWVITEETLATLAASKAWITFGQLEGPSELLGSLVGMSWDTEAALRKRLDADFGSLPASLRKDLVKLAAVADPEAQVITKRNGAPEPDPDLRDQENVALPADLHVRHEPDPSGRLASFEYVELAEQHLKAEVHPYVQDAWIDHTKTKIGYEIPVTRHFYEYVPPRPLCEIDAEIKRLEAEIQKLLHEVTE
jgi:type I restriction enzyme M protein